jgi:hypothetical protein
MENHTVYVTDANGRPYERTVLDLSEEEFTRWLRDHPTMDQILALCDRVDEVQKEAGVYEQNMMRALARRSLEEREADAIRDTTVLMSLNEE